MSNNETEKTDQTLKTIAKDLEFLQATVNSLSCKVDYITAYMEDDIAPAVHSVNSNLLSRTNDLRQDNLAILNAVGFHSHQLKQDMLNVTHALSGVQDCLETKISGLLPPPGAQYAKKTVKPEPRDTSPTRKMAKGVVKCPPAPKKLPKTKNEAKHAIPFELPAEISESSSSESYTPDCFVCDEEIDPALERWRWEKSALPEQDGFHAKCWEVFMKETPKQRKARRAKPQATQVDLTK